MSDDWINELKNEVIDTIPRENFADELRATLSDEWNGRATSATVVAAAPDLPQRRRSAAPWLLGAAAVVALVVGGAIVATNDGGSDTVQSPPVTDLDEPSTPSVPDEEFTPVPTTLPEPEPTPASVVIDSPPPAASQDLLQGWVVPPVADLESLPLALPQLPVPGAQAVERSVWQEDQDEVLFLSHAQLFMIPGTNRAIDITATFDDSSPCCLDMRGPVEGWDNASFDDSVDQSQQYENLLLTYPNGWVSISGAASRDELLTVGQSMVRRSDGRAGFDVRELPPGFVEIVEHEHWSFGASRRVAWTDGDWMVGELDVWRGGGGSFALEARRNTVTAVDINGVEGFAVEASEFDAFHGDVAVKVYWFPEPGLGYMFGLKGATVEETVEMARTVTTVDQATWEAIPEQPDILWDDGIEAGANRGFACGTIFC